jgi:hypothetical protein
MCYGSIARNSHLWRSGCCKKCGPWGSLPVTRTWSCIMTLPHCASLESWMICCSLCSDLRPEQCFCRRCQPWKVWHLLFGCFVTARGVVRGQSLTGQYSLPIWVSEASPELLEAVAIHMQERGRRDVAEDIVGLLRLSGGDENRSGLLLMFGHVAFVVQRTACTAMCWRRCTPQASHQGTIVSRL